MGQQAATENGGKPKAFRVVFFVLLGLVLLLNLFCFSPAFCDWYVVYVFPLWLDTYGRFSDLFPFSLGQVLIGAGILLVLAAAVLLPFTLVSLWKYRKMRGAERRQGLFLRFSGGFYRVFLYILLLTALLMTLNCSIPYRCSRLTISDREDYTIGELRKLRNYLVEQCNAYAQQFPRDAQGRLAVFVSVREMDEASRRAMQDLADRYPRLGGYYPDMKPVFHSQLMVQSGMAGVYFPFSMESNYNAEMYFLNDYAVFSHERAHIKGYMFEEEANFFAYLACTGSEDPLCRYSGYLSVLGYVDNDFYASTTKEDYLQQVRISPEVCLDDIFVTEEVRQKAAEESGISAETATEMNHTFMDGYLDYYDIEGGRASYARVTGLLLQYYDVNGYE